jgi:hypothetical protein
MFWSTILSTCDNRVESDVVDSATRLPSGFGHGLQTYSILDAACPSRRVTMTAPSKTPATVPHICSPPLRPASARRRTSGCRSGCWSSAASFSTPGQRMPRLTPLNGPSSCSASPTRCGWTGRKTPSLHQAQLLRLARILILSEGAERAPPLRTFPGTKRWRRRWCGSWIPRRTWNGGMRCSWTARRRSGSPTLRAESRGCR